MYPLSVLHSGSLEDICLDISPYAILGLVDNAPVADAQAAFDRISAALHLLADDDKMAL